MNRLVEELKKIDLMEAEAFDYGQGLDPLLQEFVYDVPSLPEEARITRTRHISDYFQKVYSRSANIAKAYKETKKWAMRSYVQHHIKKIRRTYGLPESLNEANVDPYEFQDSHQEELIHSNWNAYSFRYDLEGAGDIFRELAKDFNDMHYIMEKVRRIEIFIEDTMNKTIHDDDSMEKAQREDPEKLEQLLRFWLEQPTDTEEQELAKNLNIELVKGNLDNVKIFLNNIKSLKYDGNQLKIEEL